MRMQHVIVVTTLLDQSRVRCRCGVSAHHGMMIYLLVWVSVQKTGRQILFYIIALEIGECATHSLSSWFLGNTVIKINTICDIYATFHIYSAAMPPLTSPRVIVMTTTPSPSGSSAIDHSFSLIGELH